MDEPLIASEEMLLKLQREQEEEIEDQKAKTFEEVPPSEEDMADIDNDKKYKYDDIEVVSPDDDDIQEELSTLGEFSHYQEESRGNGLTFGDY